ncbi:MAG: sigma-70 family RNA polymerase sigma factor [Kiritimatiellae bacterium]|nr:sigma-70 family RNA polymerase sigma factor [Kiritimatiellia bacterium]
MNSLQDTDDDALVALGRGGSEAALTELYRRYRARVMGYAYRMTGDLPQAEDIFQSVFAYFFQNLARYEARGKLAAYLLRMARSMAVDETRRSRRLLVGLPAGTDDELRWAFAPPPSPDASPAEAAAAAETARRAREAVLALPDRLREVAVLRLYEGLDYAAIGEITGAGEPTARSRMRYALQALRKTLGGRIRKYGDV